METFWSTSHAAGAQSSYLESLYESYLDNPLSIPDDWKIYFDSLPQINGAQEEVSHKEIINKFKEENALLSQAWVMEPKKKVQDIVKELSITDLKIKDFYRLKIGE